MQMSIFKLAFYVTLGETAVRGFSRSIQMDAKIRSIADEVLQPDQVLKSLGKLAEGDPDQLLDRVCSEKLLRMTPVLNCGNLGCEKRAECAAKVSDLAHLAGVATGLISAVALSASLFKSCLSKPGTSMGFCVEDFNSNLMYGKLGFALGAIAVGGYWLSQFLIFSRLKALSGDLFPAHRVNQMKGEYEALGKGLKDIQGRAIDPQEIATIHRLAQKLLDQMPAIKQAICKAASLEKEEAASVALPLENACRHVLVSTTAQPPKAEAPTEATAVPNQPLQAEAPAASRLSARQVAPWLLLGAYIAYRNS